MGDKRPIHIESKVTTAWDRADAGHGAPGPHASASRVVRGPGRWSRLVGVVAVVGLLAGGLLWWAGDAEGDDDGGDEPSCGGIAGDRARAVRIAFHEARYRLLQDGSFAYGGEVHAAEPTPPSFPWQSSFRPGGWTAGDVTVKGAVLLGDRFTRDIAVDATGQAVETVTSGPEVWTRSASTLKGLGAARWAFRTSAGPTWLGTAAVAYLVLSARDPQAVAPDAAGRCVIRATLPAADQQDGHAYLPVGADLLVTLDDDGNMAHIVVISTPDDPELVLELDVMRPGFARTARCLNYRYRLPDPERCVVAQSEASEPFSSALHPRWPYGNTHRNVQR